MFTAQTLTSIINQLLPEPHAGLLAGLLFGTKAALSRELYNALVISGTLHIVALSGMNITIIADLFAKSLLWVVSKRISSLLTLFGIIWFVWFVGPSPSVVRAAIMGSISLLAIIFGRQNWAILTWILAVGVMLLLHFSWLFDLSFQLSALATLGIILFGGKEMRGSGVSFFEGARLSQSGLQTAFPSSLNEAPLPRQRSVMMENTERVFSASQNVHPHLARLTDILGKLFADDLRLTLSAQVFTIPLILFHFHRISLISPVSNILIGWLLAPLTVLGWVTAIAGWIFLPFGHLFAWIDWVLLTYLVSVVEWTAKIPFASLGS